MLTHSRENVPRTTFTYTAFTYTAYIRHIIVHLLYRFYPGQGQTGLNGSLVYKLHDNGESRRGWSVFPWEQELEWGHVYKL